MTFWYALNCHPKQLVRNFQATHRVNGRFSLAEISCKLPTHHSGFQQHCCVGILFSSGFASKAGLPGPLGKAEDLKKQEHTGAEPPGVTIVESRGTAHPWASHGLYLREVMFQKFWWFFPQTQHFWLWEISKILASFCDKINFPKKQVNVSPRKTFQRLWHFLWQNICKVSIGLGAGLLKGEGILNFRQSKAEDSTPKDCRR